MLSTDCEAVSRDDVGVAHGVKRTRVEELVIEDVGEKKEVAINGTCRLQQP